MATNKKKSKQRLAKLVQANGSNASIAKSELEYGQAVKMFAQAEKENAYSDYVRKVKTV